jgi:hypothetical protein
MSTRASRSQQHDLVKAALVLPDGVGIRNFLLGSFLSQARGRLSLEVFTSIPEARRSLYEASDEPRLSWHAYEDYHDTPSLFMLRNAISYAHMYSVDTWGMRCVRELPITGSVKRRTAGHLAKWAGRAARRVGATPYLVDRLSSQVARLPEMARYRQLFQRIQPDVVLSSNQRPFGVLPVVLAARALGIPTATCIFSWDNLTSKGRIAAPFDHYLVWSELMRGELLRYYPHVDPDHVHVVGAVQFDPYADSRCLMSRQEFFRSLGADPARPLICYSAGEPIGCPEDQAHIAVLMRLIRSGRIARNPQVVLRPVPTIDGSRFDDVRRQYPELIYAKPQWVPGGDSWTMSLPSAADVHFLANLTQHADLNINVGSTMTLDFSIHDKPVVNIAFDCGNPPPGWQYYYLFHHYQPVVEHEVALIARSVDEFADHINTYLRDPGLHRANRRWFVDLEVGAPIGDAGGRIVEQLERIAGRPSRTRRWPRVAPVAERRDFSTAAVRVE